MLRNSRSIFLLLVVAFPSWKVTAQLTADTLHSRVARARSVERGLVNRAAATLDARRDSMRAFLAERTEAMRRGKRFVEGGEDSIRVALSQALRDVDERFAMQHASVQRYGSMADSLLTTWMQRKFVSSKELDDALAALRQNAAAFRAKDDEEFIREMTERMDGLLLHISETVESRVEEFPAGGPVQQNVLREQTPPSPAPQEKRSAGLIGLTAASTYSHLGRRPSEHPAAFIPTAHYESAMGIELRAALLCLSPYTTFVNEADLAIGYILRASQRLTLGVRFEGFLYRDSSAAHTRTFRIEGGAVPAQSINPHSALSLHAAYRMDRAGSIFADVRRFFSGGQDAELVVGVRRTVRLAQVGGGNLLFIPEASAMFASVVRYYLTGAGPVFEPDLHALEICDYRFLAPLRLVLGRVACTASCALELPRNSSFRVSGRDFVTFAVATSWAF